MQLRIGSVLKVLHHRVGVSRRTLNNDVTYITLRGAMVSGFNEKAAPNRLPLSVKYLGASAARDGQWRPGAISHASVLAGPLVYPDLGRGDLARLVAGQPAHGVGDVLWLGCPGGKERRDHLRQLRVGFDRAA